MAKNTVSDWDATAGNNTDVGGINIAENCAAANVNNGMREMMAQLATFYATLGTASTGDIGTDVQAYDANLPTWPATVDATEVGYLNGVTSAIQTQLDAKLGTADILDEDDMASDAADKAPSQQSTKAYVDAQVSLPDPSASVATTSGTSVDITGIAAGAKRITIFFSGVSKDAATETQVQLGDAGGMETTGYFSASGDAGGTSHSTAGLVIRDPGAADALAGTMVLEHLGGNEWVASHSLAKGTSGSNAACSGGGSKTLSGELTQIRLTSFSGTAAFDAGAVRIRVET